MTATPKTPTSRVKITAKGRSAVYELRPIQLYLPGVAIPVTESPP